MLKLLSSGEIEAFNLFINSEKDILQLNIFSPISRIEEDKNEFILINCSKIRAIYANTKNNNFRNKLIRSFYL